MRGSAQLPRKGRSGKDDLSGCASAFPLGFTLAHLHTRLEKVGSTHGIIAGLVSSLEFLLLSAEQGRITLRSRFRLHFRPGLQLDLFALRGVDFGSVQKSALRIFMNNNKALQVL
ncbi:hypothetical protein [uncultured Ruegeria sp.]|uniref:hypothetical protein n=1 Tax=uncultured Ruegeria sp. TaxID=259304 RepID=UPI002621DBDC|nr:hypothetical protein [uncultured Ruegeria sp.]